VPTPLGELMPEAHPLLEHVIQAQRVNLGKHPRDLGRQSGAVVRCLFDEDLEADDGAIVRVQ
jgi:hypothetical protein